MPTRPGRMTMAPGGMTTGATSDDGGSLPE
ncbi:uncharacterized protein SOCE26_106640 [Sorangium cellulosum]|uniref:Uncharacterized protein n=1 Tax=Sorangium cellulosum TaxID=56 RepID=A0A2L0FCF7_SORCE|nr:uncharacterized protein SOCE26_106640 [Sorangium cellulosum]